MSSSAKSTVTMSTVMRDISDALSLDRNDRKEEAYRKYLECVLRISTKLLKDLHAEGGHVNFDKEVTKFSKLGQQCMERAAAIAAEQATKGPRPVQGSDKRRVFTPGLVMSLPASLPSSGVDIAPKKKSRARSESSNKKLTPTEMAVKHNQQLLAAYKARTEKNRSLSASQTLALTVQRKMAENLAIAKAREEALAKKMRERQKRLEEQAARRFHTPIGMSEEEQQQRQIYTKILEFEQEEIWVLDLRKQLGDSPDDVLVIFNLIEKVLCCETHPLTQQMKVYQEKTLERIYPLVQNKTEQVNLVRVPLPTHLLSILTKFQKDQINITSKNTAKPKTENEKISDDIRTGLEKMQDSSEELNTNENGPTVENEDCISIESGKEDIEQSQDQNQGDENPNLPDFEALEKEKQLYSFDEDRESMKCNFVDITEKDGEVSEIAGENPEDIPITKFDDSANVSVDSVNQDTTIEANRDSEIKDKCSQDSLNEVRERKENGDINCVNESNENGKIDSDMQNIETIAEKTDKADTSLEKKNSKNDSNKHISDETNSDKDKDSASIKSGTAEVSFKKETKENPENKSENEVESERKNKIELKRKESEEDKILNKVKNNVDSLTEQNLSDTTKSIKRDLETAMVKGQQLKDKLERENKILMSHGRISSIDIEKYNEENMDDLFDTDEEDDDADDSAFGSSFYSSTSGSWRTNSQASETNSRKTLSTQISKISSDAQSDVGISLDINETDNETVEKAGNNSESEIAGNCTKDENENKRNSLTKNVSFQNLESAIKQLRNDAYHRHLKNITEDILTSIEKIQVLFVIGFEQLDTAEGRDQCNVLVEKHFFKPIWKYLLMLFRLANEPKEIAIAHMMTLKEERQPADFSVRQKLCLTSPDNSDFPYQAAVTELCRVVEKPTMLDKLDCLVKTSRLVLLCVDQYYEQKDKDVSEKPSIGADDLLPVLCYVVARSKLPEIVSECHAMERFIHEGYMYGEEGYCLTSFQTAINYLISEGMKSAHCDT